MQVQPVSVADAVADELRRRLLAGSYASGEQLRDTDLAAEFGVARPTVRAAVATLVADGLLERGRGRSALVRSFTAEDAIDLYRVRRPIEAAAVGLVVGRAAPPDGVEAATAAFLALEDGVAWDVVADRDVEFHRAIFAAAGSARLLRTFDEVGTELRLLVAMLKPTYEHVTDLAAEHAGLLEVLRSGDAASAQAAWSAHFDSSERFFLHILQERTA
jgi:DNA-binding GntR family transcriptional regulator